MSDENMNTLTGPPASCPNCGLPLVSRLAAPCPDCGCPESTWTDDGWRCAGCWECEVRGWPKPKKHTEPPEACPSCGGPEAKWTFDGWSCDRCLHREAEELFSPIVDRGRDTR